MTEKPATSGRTQAERTARTRRQILEATLLCLEREGFSQTTTVRIQAAAQVTRGRLLHQFPSKVDLLVAAVQHLANERFAELADQGKRFTGQDRVRFAVDSLWSTYHEPLFWAATELWLAARHDEILRAALLPEERRLGVVIRGLCDELFGRTLVSRRRYPELRDLLVTSMRGVAMTYAFDPRDFRTDPHVQRWYALAGRLLSVRSLPDPTAAKRPRRPPVD